jgi:signal transduction histidine kinase
VIAGLSENLTQEKVADEKYLPETVRRDIERIHDSAQHLDGLIRDVLDLASSQVGQLKLVNETLDIADVLKPVIAIGERLAREKGLEWRSSVPTILPPIVFDRGCARYESI